MVEAGCVSAFSNQKYSVLHLTNKFDKIKKINKKKQTRFKFCLKYENLTQTFRE